MDSEAAWRRKSNRELANQLRPLLEEAYGPLPASDAWLEQLVNAIREEMETPADAVPAAVWAFSDQPELSEGAADALARPEARPLLVQLVAELAHVVLLDQATATRIVSHLQAHFREARGWDATDVETVIRAALTGRRDGASLATIMSLLGRERCMRRIAASLQ